MASTQNRNRNRKASRAIWLVPLALAVAVAIAVAALAADDGGGNGTTTGGGDESVAHVHGLGINPSDGTLYAATHHGLFRVPEEGGAVRLGVVRDLMGFTVAGPDVFLASGHPGVTGDPLLEPGARPLLGLIRSTDGGETWEPVSLLGEVDFHALRAAHDLVYGYDATSGRFMVSADGESWEVRGQIPMGDFAVAPDDLNHIIAMTERGLAESLDGGRTWSPVEGPTAAFLSWHPVSGLWAAGGNGEIHVRTASGWESREPLPGPPQALLVTDDELFAAASDGGSTGIYVSDDDARSWELRYSDQQ